MVIHIHRAEDLPKTPGVYEIEYQGIPIVYISFASTNEEEFLAVIPKAAAVIRQPKNQGKKLLTLTSMTNAKYNKITSKAIKEYAEANEPFVFARAVTGMTDAMKAFFNFMKTFVRLNIFDPVNAKAFEKTSDALVWLAEEGRRMRSSAA